MNNDILDDLSETLTSLLLGYIDIQQATPILQQYLNISGIQDLSNEVFEEWLYEMEDFQEIIQEKIKNILTDIVIEVKLKKDQSEFIDEDLVKVENFLNKDIV